MCIQFSINEQWRANNWKAQGSNLEDAINKYYLDYTSKIDTEFRMYYDRVNLFKSYTGEYIIRDGIMHMYSTNSLEWEEIRFSLTLSLSRQ